MANQTYTYQQIGIARTPFDEKFGTPRQPGLVNEARGRIEIHAPFNQSDAFKGLETFSHIWLLFHFHLTPDKEFQPTVRPPRLGGNDRIGVFATRSPFRPNRIGQSVVRLLEVQPHSKGLALIVEGIDLVDQTPILDVKPYLAYCESHPEATSGFAQNAPGARLNINWSPTTRQQIQEQNIPKTTLSLFEAVLSQDPRPAYQRAKNKTVGGLTLDGVNLKYEIEEGELTALSIKMTEN